MLQPVKIVFLLAAVAASLLLTAAAVATGRATITLAAVAVGFAASGILYLMERPNDVRRWRREHGRCERCGYDLRGNVSGVCPECGRTR